MNTFRLSKGIMTLMMSLILFSCQKNTSITEDTPIPKHHLESYIVSSVDYENGTKTTYQNGIIAYRTPIDAFSSSVIFEKNGQRIETIASYTVKNNIRYWKLSDKNGNEYYRIALNKNNAIGDFKVSANIPNFTSKADVPQVAQILPFGECMNKLIAKCASEWACTISCTVLWQECFLGFGIACVIASE